MNDDFLRSRLNRVARRQRRLALFRLLAVCWAVAALGVVAGAGLQRAFGWNLPGSPAGRIGFAVAALAGAVAVAWRLLRRPVDYRWVARKIEAAHPELNGLLLTAVQEPAGEGKAPDFLRYRVLREAIAKSQEQDWRRTVPVRRLVFIQVVHAIALACFVGALAGSRETQPAPAGDATVSADGVAVSPGDTQLERGETLVVLARFERDPPASATLVLQEDGAAARAIPLVRNLADPVFGGSVTDVARSLTYHLEYGGRRTRAFAVQVFEHPRLVRADVDLTYPAYTQLAPRHIGETRRVSAVEGTKVDVTLHLNKPVSSARLVARDAAKTAHPVAIEPGRPAAALRGWVPAWSGTYDLQLVDAEGRTNKVAAPFVIEVQPNRPPEIRLTAPAGDVRPSALEEISFRGTVWDDFGTSAFGLAYATTAGGLKSIELGRGVPAKGKRSFTYLLKLEDLGVRPDDLVSWHVWAEDIGPDGESRRSQGDLFFAEIRPFDEVFRESQGMAGGEESSSPGGGDGTRRLAELQKQIISATWKLQRSGGTPEYARDVNVVGDSQRQALAQAREAAGDARSPRARGLWEEATREMERATERLDEAKSAPSRVAEALPPEQAAYQALLKLQSRETAVTRGQRGRSGGANRGQAERQRQIDQLDLQQAENRYETMRQARAPQDPRQREQLAIMNRLQDLARRQQDLNERLNEMQTALQEAQTEPRRAELRERLKRLEDEQRQMLADADELRQRLDRPDNQEELSPQRQQLDRARDDLQRAADATGRGAVAQAVASGTRAQRQLQQARDELRERSSSRFAEDLRDMRGEARELSRRQESLERQLAATEHSTAPRRRLGDPTENPELAGQVARQRERWNRLLERARDVSEQAETSEPLVAQQLYDAVRSTTQADDASVAELQQDLLGRGQLTLDLRDRLEQAARSGQGGKALAATSEMLRQGYTGAARESARRAGEQIENLRRGVERAAGSVLGDDTEQLRLARSELDALSDALRRELEPGRDGGADRDARSADRPAGREGTADSDEDGKRPDHRLAQDQAREPQDRTGESDAEARKRTGGPERRDAGAEERVAQDDGAARGQSADAGVRGPGRGDGGVNIGTLLDGGAGNGAGGGGRAWAADGPLTGDAFAPWTDRLRDVEQLLDEPGLRDAVAVARERARSLRREFTQSRRKPDWAVVQLQVVQPLVEVRNRVADELARRQSRDALAPLDHDPVPARFAESVRRYYEELGRSRPSAPQPAATGSNNGPN